MYVPNTNYFLTRDNKFKDTMITSTTSTEFWCTANNKYTTSSMYRGVAEASIDSNNRVDLIVDVHIDPVLERHMTIRTRQQSKTVPKSIQQLLDKHKAPSSTTTNTVSPTEKKRYRLQPREGMPRMDSESQYSFENIDKIPAFEDMDSYGTFFSTKRVKRTNEPPSWTKEKEWTFVPYPSHVDIEVALMKCRGISQLLAPWKDISKYIGSNEEVDLSQIDDEDDEEANVDEVERALLRFHVTSGDWNESNIQRNQSSYYQRHVCPPEFERAGAHIPADSVHDEEQLASPSFLEQVQLLPPTLMRVTTSTILEEQEFIWTQIKQERRDLFLHRRDTTGCSVWQHEVTRGHQIRPPVSPELRNYMIYPEPMSGDVGTSQPDQYQSNVMPSLCTPPRSTTKLTANESKVEPSHHRLSSIRLSTISKTNAIPSQKGPAKVTPQRNDNCGATSQVIVACLECQSPLVLPQTFNATIIHCSKCGVMASTDMLRTY